MKKFYLSLQFFADGGDGGAASVGGAASSGTSDVASIEAKQTPTADNLGIPEHVMRKVYKGGKRPADTAKADVAEVKATKPATTATEDAQSVENKSEAKDPTYEELIKSDKYKKAHELNIKRIVDSRVKNLSAEAKASADLLEAVAVKYGLDATSKTFRDDLRTALDNDDTYVSRYAEEHDMSNEEAKRVVDMDLKLKRLEREKQEAEKAEATRQLMSSLMKNAEATKARFPEFDLDTMMERDDFRRMIGITKGNTTAAYMACCYDSVIQSTARAAEERGKSAVMESVKNNAQRPVENGMSQSATAVVKTDPKNMSLKDIKSVAEHFRRTGERIKF